MIESIINSLSHLPGELVVFLISLMPILELRGGLIASSILGIDWKIAFPICVIGNVIPIPFILLFIDKIFDLLRKTRFSKIVDFFEKKANNKSKYMLRYKEWGLFTFVALPLPGTGGWMGALIAAMMRLDKKKSMLIIFLGVLTAGIIMSLLSYVIPNLFF